MGMLDVNLNVDIDHKDLDYIKSEIKEIELNTRELEKSIINLSKLRANVYIDVVEGKRLKKKWYQFWKK